MYIREIANFVRENPSDCFSGAATELNLFPIHFSCLPAALLRFLSILCLFVFLRGLSFWYCQAKVVFMHDVAITIFYSARNSQTHWKFRRVSEHALRH